MKYLFEENVTNRLRKNFYQKDGHHYQSVMNGHIWSQFLYWPFIVITIYRDHQ